MRNNQKHAFERALRPLNTLIQDKATSHIHSVFETLVTEWTLRAYPGVSCDGFAHISEAAESPSLVRMTEWLSSLDFIEATYWLSSIYAIWSGEKHRKHFAVFFTPPSITRRVIDDIVSSGICLTNAKFIDPACGGAAFLGPLVERMREALIKEGRSADETLRHISENVHGTDIDEQLCRLSRHFLRIALRREISETGTDPEFRIARADSLYELSTQSESFDVVLCNPPYRKMTSDEVARAKSRYGHIIQGQPNLYALFITLCMDLLRQKGTAALVTPTSFLSGQYFSRLRSKILELTEVFSISVINERRGVFIDVEQNTALTYLRKAGQGKVETNTSISAVAKDGSYTTIGRMNLGKYDSDPWPIPKVKGDTELVERVRNLPCSLEDYGYRVRAGSFVWNRDTRETYFANQLPKNSIDRPIYPLIWASDIGPQGKLLLRRKRTVAIEPSHVDIGSTESTAIVRRPSLVLQRVTSNDQPKRLVGAVVDANLFLDFRGFVAENHVLVLERYQNDRSPSPETLREILISPIMDRFFRCISGSTNVSAYELRQIRLPSIDDLEAATISRGCTLAEALEVLISTS